MFSILDMFSIGVGPSSSHTVGPMRAAHAFVSSLAECGLLDGVHRVRVTPVRLAVADRIGAWH